MQLTVNPGGPLKGTVTLPGDKSISHRAILFASLADGSSRVENLLVAGVTERMLAAVRDLGVSISVEGTTLAVEGRGLRGFQAPLKPLDCGHSATTMRLLAGACAAAGIPVVLDGSPGLRTRPMSRVVDPLWDMGVPIQALGDDGTAPLQIATLLDSMSLQALDYSSPVASAQLKSCLLLAGLAAENKTIYVEPAPSRDHTERMFEHMGVALKREVRGDGSVRVLMEPLGDRVLSPLHMTVPGDISSAGFLIVAGLITPGSDVVLSGVGLNPTRCGLLDALREMGAHLEISNRKHVSGEPVGDIRVNHSPLRGITVEDPLVVRMIDELPIFAVAAACAQGETVVRDAAELRLKETDRIAALCEELDGLGVEVEEREDGFHIQGGRPLQGGRVSSHGDHRMAMALAVAGLAAEDAVQVRGAEMVDESFPRFGETLRSLGANLEGEGSP